MVELSRTLGNPDHTTRFGDIWGQVHESLSQCQLSRYGGLECTSRCYHYITTWLFVPIWLILPTMIFCKFCIVYLCLHVMCAACECACELLSDISTTILSECVCACVWLRVCAVVLSVCIYVCESLCELLSYSTTVFRSQNRPLISGIISPHHRRCHRYLCRHLRHPHSLPSLRLTYRHIIHNGVSHGRFFSRTSLWQLRQYHRPTQFKDIQKNVKTKCVYVLIGHIIICNVVFKSNLRSIIYQSKYWDTQIFFYSRKYSILIITCMGVFNVSLSGNTNQYRRQRTWGFFSPASQLT